MNEYFNLPVLKFQKMNLKISIVQSDLIKFKTETSLEERAKLFENKLAKLKKYYLITHVFVEEPFIAFGGGKTTAHTMAKLQRFNGMCSYGVYNIFESLPIMVNVRVARSNLGIKIPKGTKQNDTKKFIIEYVERVFEELNN